jgi:hypothetical protein
MSRLTPHWPNFVGGDPPEPEEFNTQEELLKTNWLRKFKGFAITIKKAVWDENGERNVLMGVHSGGRFWWCIGCIDSTEGIDLPEWNQGCMPERIVTVDGSMYIKDNRKGMQ